MYMNFHIILNGLLYVWMKNHINFWEMQKNHYQCVLEIMPKLIPNTYAIEHAVYLLLFNHLMGFWGMLLGVPLFASFYYLLREFINARLRKKSLPLETQEYVHVSGIDEKGSISYLPPPVIEFHPLFRGEDSLWARLRRRLRHPLSPSQDSPPDNPPSDDDPSS